MSSRGLVVAPRFTWDGSKLHFPGAVGLESSDLRSYVLYWDRLEFPDNNLISVPSSPDVQFLQDIGILTRTRVKVTGTGNLGLGYLQAQFVAFRYLDAAEPGRWAIGQSAVSYWAP